MTKLCNEGKNNTGLRIKLESTLKMILGKTKNFSKLLDQIFHKIPLILKKALINIDNSFLTVFKIGENIFEDKIIYRLIIQDLERIKEIIEIRKILLYDGLIEKEFEPAINKFLSEMNCLKALVMLKI